MGVKKIAAKLAVVAMAGAATLGGALSGTLGGNAAAAPLGSGYAHSSTDQSQCTSTMVVAIPGGGNTIAGIPESIPHGYLVGEAAKQLSQQGIAQRTVSYQAQPFFTHTYKESWRDGYTKARRTIARTAAECPGAKIALVGFSEGSDIGSHITADIAEGRGPIPADRFAAAAFIANPKNGPASAKKGGTLHDGVGILGAMPSYGSLANQVMDICNVDDFICNRYAATPGARHLAEDLLNASVFTGLGGVDPMRFITEAPRLVMGTHNHVQTYRHTQPIPQAVDHILAHRDGAPAPTSPGLNPAQNPGLNRA